VQCTSKLLIHTLCCCGLYEHGEQAVLDIQPMVAPLGCLEMAHACYSIPCCVWSVVCRFFIFVAYLFLLHQMGTALFRLMGALGEYHLLCTWRLLRGCLSSHSTGACCSASADV
jgi:hypothetical protein